MWQTRKSVRAISQSVFIATVGMARCAVPAHVVAGGTNIRATLAFEGVAPLHAARTSQRDVPTTLNTYKRAADHSITSRNHPPAVQAFRRAFCDPPCRLSESSSRIGQPPPPGRAA